MRVEERELFFVGLGNIIFRKNPRAKRLVIRVKPDGKVSVTIPFLVSYRQASLFVEKKTDWILKIQKKFKKDFDSLILFKEGTEFNTVNHKVQIQKYSGNHVRKKKINEIVIIQIPEADQTESLIIQEKIRRLIIETWREEAKEILLKKIEELAAKHNFHYMGIRIKNMKSRWGSCSKENIINLNLHLIRLPIHLRDYILLHELVHTVHKNHGKEFWKMLNDITIDAKKLSKELKNLNIEIW
jgi:predicted metal-dependent hydrolase